MGSSILVPGTSTQAMTLSGKESQSIVLRPSSSIWIGVGSCGSTVLSTIALSHVARSAVSIAAQIRLAMASGFFIFFMFISFIYERGESDSTRPLSLALS